MRDLLAWSSGLRRSLITEEKVSDAASAQLLKTEHDNLKAEIETREKMFSEVVTLGEAMVTEEHGNNITLPPPGNNRFCTLVLYFTTPPCLPQVITGSVHLYCTVQHHPASPLGNNPREHNVVGISLIKY